MPTGKQANDPVDFNSLSQGLTTASNDFGKRMKDVSKQFGDHMLKNMKKAADKFRKWKERNIPNIDWWRKNTHCKDKRKDWKKERSSRQIL